MQVRLEAITGPVAESTALDPILSPSQINTFRECQRKWGYEQILKKEKTSNRSAMLGTDCHALLEDYMETGELDQTRTFRQDDKLYLAEIVAPGLVHLPKPGTPGLELEQHFVARSTATGIRYQGLKDLCLPSQALVLDHKTTSDIGKWAKTEGALATDVQAQIYAKQTLDLLRVHDVELRWVYYQTKRPYQSKRVSLRVVQAHADEQFSLIEETSKEMVELRRNVLGPSIDGLPANERMCHAYGGCPFISICSRSSSSRKPFASLFQSQERQENTPMSFRKNAAPEQEPRVTTTIVVDPINPPEGSAALPAEPPAPAEETPKRRGRPSGAKNKKADVVVEPEQRSAEPSLTVNPHVSDKKIGLLLIDAMPIHSGSEDTPCFFERDILPQAEKVVEEQFEVSDYRFLDFGKGGGALLQAVNKVLDDGEATSYPILVVSTTTPQGQVALTALIQNAEFVIRGVR